MVFVGEFCIDSTELTSEQYARFVSANTDPKNQDAVCAWNSTFAPDNGGWCEFGTYDPIYHPQRPVSCVDWCDAYAYCKWAGKRLCGRVGGGTITIDEYASTNNEWTYACSSAGQYAYPYGQQYSPTACNGADVTDCVVGKGTCVAQEADAFPDCAAPDQPFAAVKNLSGNVAEWEDSCKGATGFDDVCRFRGGMILDIPLYLQCSPPDTSEQLTVRGGLGQGIGIRCCADAL